LVSELDTELNGIRALEVKNVGLSEGADGERCEKVLSVSEREDSAVVEATLEVGGHVRLVASSSSEVDLAGLKVVGTLKSNVGIGW
jgi:hypothetical protein